MHLLIATGISCASSGRTYESVASTSSGGAGGALALGSSTTVGSGVGGSSEGAGGDVGAGGSAPSDCWSADPTFWKVESFDSTALSGTAMQDAMISPDAMTLTYSAADSAGRRRIYQATRNTRSEPFKGGVSIADWPTIGDVGQPWAALDGEMWMSLDGDIARSVLSGGLWSVPQKLLSSTATDAVPSLTGSGIELFVSRDDGPPNAVIGPVWRIYHASRPAPASPADSFGALSAISLPPTGNADALLCPRPSPDGTRMFFSTNYPDAITAQNVGHVVKLYYTERPDASPDTKWATAIHISQFDDTTEEVCPMAVSADGCELWISHFGSSFEVFVAHRSP